MNNISVKDKLHQLIDKIDDNKAKFILALIDNNINIETNRMQLILQERLAYLNGDKKTFSFDEVKMMARNKSLRNGL